MGHFPLLGEKDQYKQTTINKYLNEHNKVKIPNQLAIYKRSLGVELEATENSIS